MPSTERLPTEPLREEHRELLPRIQELGRLGAELPGLGEDEARRRLSDAVAFLRGHLVPHAEAEEAVLYPEIERAMGAPGCLATMRADHTEIVRRLGLLAEAARPGASLAEAPAQLIGLGAILGLHFRKEEEVLLPILDRRLSTDEADELFGRMAMHAHGPAHEEPAPAP